MSMRTIRRRRLALAGASLARRRLLRKTCPRVTRAEWAALRQIAAEIDESSARIREMTADLKAMEEALS